MLLIYILTAQVKVFNTSVNVGHTHTYTLLRTHAHTQKLITLSISTGKDIISSRIRNDLGVGYLFACYPEEPNGFILENT